MIELSTICELVHPISRLISNTLSNVLEGFAIKRAQTKINLEASSLICALSVNYKLTTSEASITPFKEDL